MGILGLRDFRAEPQKSFELLHGSTALYDPQGDDHVFAEIEGGAIKAQKAKVWHMSPVGVELLLPNGTEAQCHIGDAFGIKLHLGRQVCIFKSLLVSASSRHRGGARLGFRWFDEELESGFAGAERRREQRWMCPDEFLPTGVAINPAKFNDYIYFRIINISRHGLSFVTSLRNKFLVPQMVLEPIISWPMTGQSQSKVRVVRTDMHNWYGSECLFVGVECVGPDNAAHPSVLQYMLQFGSAESIVAFKRAGFQPEHPARALTFAYVRTVAQYRQVLALRQHKSMSGGKGLETTLDEARSDAYDTRSRILVVYHQHKAIGTLRMMFHEYDDRMEIEEFIDLPDHLPRREQCVEVSRFYVEPEFRSPKVVCEMLKYVAMVVLQARRRWIVTSCMEDRFWLYKLIGAENTGVTYQHRQLGAASHLVFTIDIPQTMVGWTVSPIFWNRFYADLFQYITDAELLDFTLALRVRVGLNKLLAPAAKLAFQLFYTHKE